MKTETLNAAEITYVNRNNEEIKISPSAIYFITNSNGKLIYPTTFVGNKVSKHFHYPSVLHLPDSSDQITFSTYDDALSNNYTPCPACIDLSPIFPDYYFEKALARNIFANINSHYEILYEYPHLNRFQVILDDIVSNWPEATKGYSYRLQVYKDDVPNAFALAGGHIYISSGLIGIAESPEEIRGVLAHEVAHIERRHTLREFVLQQQQNDKAFLAAIFAGSAAALITRNSSAVKDAISFTLSMANISNMIFMKGFSKELEQEADVMTQTYLEKNSIGKNNYIRMLDKLAIRSIVRQGESIGSVNIFSDHPNLRARILQIQFAKIIKYEQPLVYRARLKSKESDNQFLEMIFHYAYIGQIADPYGYLVFMVGEISNNTIHNNVRLDNVLVSINNSEPTFKLEGLDNQVISRGGKKEIGAMMRFPTGSVPDKLYDYISNKKVLIVSSKIFASDYTPGASVNTSAEIKEIEITSTFLGNED